MVGKGMGGEKVSGNFIVAVRINLTLRPGAGESPSRESGKMNHELSIHVRQEMDRRGIPLAVVESVVDGPAQIIPEHGGVVCYQSKVDINHKTYLVRVMVNERAAPPKVVTVYRTSKISKYWKTTS